MENTVELVYLKYQYPDYHGYIKVISPNDILTLISQIHGYIEVLSLPHQIRDIKVWLYLIMVKVIYDQKKNPIDVI